MGKKNIFLALAITAFLIVGCSLRKEPEYVPFSVEPTTVPESETETLQPKEQPADGPEKHSLLQVLKNQKQCFIGEYGFVTLDAYCEKAEASTDFSIIITQYAFADFDGDGSQEAIVDLQWDTGGRFIYIVLKYDGKYDAVYGTEYTDQDMSHFREGSGKMDIAWYPYTTVHPSPRKPDGKLRLKPVAADASAWQEAYTYVLIDNRVKYLEDPDGLRDYQETDMYLGLHDFDGDGTPELIFGDGISGAVFTFLDGQLMKIADICFPGTVWCVNGICFGGNSLAALCDGAGGSSFVLFGYIDGAWQLGRYTQLCDMEPTVNGRTATVEDIEKIHTTDWQILETEIKEPVQLVSEGGWAVRLDSGERIPVDQEMDWSRFAW